MDSDVNTMQFVQYSSAIRNYIVKRYDADPLFEYIDGMIDAMKFKYFKPKTYVNNVMLDTRENIIGTVYGEECKGMFVYDPTTKTVRLPDFSGAYLTNTASFKQSGTFQKSSCPNVYGSFGTNMSFAEIGYKRPPTINGFDVQYYDDNARRGAGHSDYVHNYQEISPWMPYTRNAFRLSTEGGPYRLGADRVTLNSVCLVPYIVVKSNFVTVRYISAED